jgi:sulfonate transport system ATP-binding protein
MATGLQRYLIDPAAPPDPESGDVTVGRRSAVRVRNLKRAFGDHHVLDGLDLDIAPGEFVVLLGASGCGKSTLLRVLADLDHGFNGEIIVPARRAVAFQAPRLLPWKSVWRNVVLGVPGADRAAAFAALKEVNLAHRADQWPKVLSGGEAQRASLARALVRQPDLLLLDEPFAALDALTRIKAQDLVADLWQQHGCAVLLVTHDVEEAVLLADRILVMHDGQIAHSVQVDLARPRHRSGASFVALRRQLLEWLGVVY